MTKKILFWGLALFRLLGIATAQPYGCPGLGRMMYGGYGIGGIIFSWVVGLLTIIALVLFIIWLVKQIQKK